MHHSSNFIHFSNPLFTLTDSLQHPIESFNFYWVSADTSDNLHYHNISLFESLKSDSNIFYFYIDYSSKSRTSIIQTYMDLFNKLLTKNRDLSSNDYMQLKQKLTNICESTNYFKLYLNDNLQKIQISYNVIYDDYKYEHHNFNYYLASIFKCISTYFSLCLIIENGHLLERHVVTLLSSFLLSKPSLSIVFTFPISSLSQYPSLNEFYSLVTLNQYISKRINIPSVTYHDILPHLNHLDSITQLDLFNIASLIIKKSSGSIFLINYFIKNISTLDSRFVQSNRPITVSLLVETLFNQFSEITKQCLLLACLEDSPFNLHDICRYYDGDYGTLKKEAIDSLFIIPERLVSHTSVIREHFFQFSTLNMGSIILELLPQERYDQTHRDHISFCIQTKKTISSLSVSFLTNLETSYPFPKTISKDFFSQLILEAYSSIHLEHYYIGHDFFSIILANFKDYFSHSTFFHFDIAYHHLYCKLYSDYSDIHQEWDYCFSISSNPKERALLHLFKMKWLHQKEFSFKNLIIEAKHLFHYLGIPFGFVPNNKISLLLKFSLEFGKIFFFKFKTKIFISNRPSLSSNELLIVTQALNLLVLNAPSFLMNIIIIINERIIYQATSNESPINLLSLLRKLKNGEIKKIDNEFISPSLQQTQLLQCSKTTIYSLYNLVITLFYNPLKYNLETSINDVKTSLNEKNISPNNAHHWLAFIIFQQYFQLLNGTPLTQIQQSYDLNIFFFQKNCHISSSSTVIAHANLNKELLSILADNTTFNYVDFLKTHITLITTNDHAEFILKFFIMFICFYKHDFKSVIAIATQLESKISTYVLGIYYPLFCFYYSLSLFFDNHFSSQLNPYSLQCLSNHIEVFNHLIKQDLPHFKSYYLILKAIQDFYHHNQNSHRLILEALELAIQHHQALVKLIAHEVAIIFYQDIHDHDGIKKHLNECITSYTLIGYRYKSKSLSTHYYPYLDSSNTSINEESPDNIVFLLKNKTNLPYIKESHLSYMFQCLFHFTGFSKGYFFKHMHDDLLLQYSFSSIDTSQLSIKTFPQFIQKQCYHVMASKTLLYDHSTSPDCLVSQDSYTTDQSIHDILVIPVLTAQNSIIGIIYLENNVSNKHLTRFQLTHLYHYIHLFELIIHHSDLPKNPSSDVLSFDTNLNKKESHLYSHKSMLKRSLDSSSDSDLNMINSPSGMTSLYSSDYYDTLKNQLVIIASNALNLSSFSVNTLSVTNINLLLDYIISIVQSECHKRDISIVTDFSNIPDIPLDFQNMFLVFFHFLLHSMDSIHHHESIIISTSLHAHDNMSFITISFVNSSKHNSNDNFDNIFNLFDSFHDSSLDVNLSMVLAIIDSHDGTINISSNLDNYMGVSITLPYSLDLSNETISQTMVSSLPLQS